MNTKRNFLVLQILFIPVVDATVVFIVVEAAVVLIVVVVAVVLGIATESKRDLSRNVTSDIQFLNGKLSLVPNGLML